MGLCKCFLRSILFSLITIAVIIFIPNLPPYTNISKSLSIPKVKPIPVNEKLKNVELWQKGKLNGPEAFTEYNGELYTTLHGGVVAKLVNDQIITVVKTGKPCKHFYEEKICGRPLGIQFDKDGLLYVAEPYYGILRFNLKKDTREVIVSPNDKIGGKKPMIFNSLAVASNGDIFWSDSSSQYQLENLVFDVLSDPSGRLIHYDAKTKKNKVLIDNLHFANGVILSKDEDFVLVAETFANRVHRYYLKGPKKGTSDVFLDSLPGMADNLKDDGGDGFLVPLVEAIDNEHPSIGQLLFEFPLARKFVARLMALGELAIQTVDGYYPTEMAKSAVHFIGHYRSVSSFKEMTPHQMILRVSKTGEIIDSLSTTDKKLRLISEAAIFKDHLYLGSPSNDYIGRIPLSEIGWSSLKVKRSVAEEKTQQKTTTTTTTTTTTPRPTTTTPKPTTTTTPRPTTTTPKPTTTTPRPTTTTPKPTTTTTPKPTKATTAQPKKEAKPASKQQKQDTPPPVKSTPPPKKEAPKVKETKQTGKVKNEL